MFKYYVFLFAAFTLIFQSCVTRLNATEACTCEEKLTLVKDSNWKAVLKFVPEEKKTDGLFQQVEISIIDSAAFQAKRKINLSDTTIARVQFDAWSIWMTEPEYLTKGELELQSWTDSTITLYHNLQMKAPEYRFGGKYKLKGTFTYRVLK